MSYYIVLNNLGNIGEVMSISPKDVLNKNKSLNKRVDVDKDGDKSTGKIIEIYMI